MYSKDIQVYFDPMPNFKILYLFFLTCIDVLIAKSIPKKGV